MNFSLRATIRDRVAPEHRLSCKSRLWRSGLAELHRRGGGRRESGAFLLGEERQDRRRITRFVYYDDLERHCLDTGIVIFEGTGFGTLWQLCRESGLRVVADVHTHPEGAGQSPADRDNPMIALPGHIALIVPDFARRAVGSDHLGVYEYAGDHHWRDRGGAAARNYFYIGFWG